ncbi:hypothetical protein R84B8_01808 [Treponema sp. R8-4-B8]
MKKPNLIFMIFLVLLPCFNLYGQKKTPLLDYPEPVFDKPFSYVIDTFKEEGNQKDRIILHSFSADKNIRFNIYYHEPKTKEWIFYGTGILKDVGDTDRISPSIKIDVNKGDNKIWLYSYRYFAIESLDNKNYKYQLYKSNNNLNINVIGPTMGFATTFEDAFSERLEKTVIGMNIKEFKEVWPEASLSGRGENSETYDIIYSHMVTMSSLFTSVSGYDYQFFVSFYFVNNKLIKYESHRR